MLPPDLLFPPPRTSFRVRHWGDPARVPRSGPFNLRRERCHPNLHGSAPPKLKLGLDLGTWQANPLLGKTSSSPCDLSRGYEAGGAVSEIGHGRSYQTHTHTRTHAPAARLREKQSSDCSLEAAQTQSFSSWHVGAVPVTQGTTPRPEAGGCSKLGLIHNSL